MVQTYYLLSTPFSEEFYRVNPRISRYVPQTLTRTRLEKLLTKAAIRNSLITLITEYCYFLQSWLSPNVRQFSQLVYTLPDNRGIPIGSPLEFLISKVIMEKFESKLFESGSSLLTHSALWRHCVDDILCVWPGPIELIPLLVTFM